MTVPERILTQVLVMEDGCHEWIGFTNTNGYGRTKIEGQMWQIHRFFYSAAGNFLPNYKPGEMQLDHLCLNKSCCNVRHLDLVTQHENMQRRYADNTNCPNGHEYTVENTGCRRGRRHCKECARQSSRRFRLKKRGN